MVKIEVNSLGTNVRYVVTDFKGQRSSFIYSECYCDRGRMEQMISELKNGLNADRMSCNRFSANQFRLYLHCAAYVILHSFQADMLVGTELECSTITECCFQAHREAFTRKSVWLQENPGQSDGYCEDKAWRL